MEYKTEKAKELRKKMKEIEFEYEKELRKCTNAQEWNKLFSEKYEEWRKLKKELEKEKAI